MGPVAVADAGLLSVIEHKCCLCFPLLILQQGMDGNEGLLKFTTCGLLNKQLYLRDGLGYVLHWGMSTCLKSVTTMMLNLISSSICSVSSHVTSYTPCRFYR